VDGAHGDDGAERFFVVNSQPFFGVSHDGGQEEVSFAVGRSPPAFAAQQDSGSSTDGILYLTDQEAQLLFPGEGSDVGVFCLRVPDYKS